MTINAKNLLDRARRLIQDETSVRWPLPELRLWLNDALREIAVIKPTAFSDSIVFVLAPGTHQRLPDGYFSIMRVVRNLKSITDYPRQAGNAVRTVDLAMLDAHNANWHDSAKVKFQKIVKNATFDAADPRSFYVYPGNDGTGIVEVIVSKIPTFIAAPASNPDSLESYDVPIDAQDIYFNVILDYVLYRAYSKDASYAGSAQRAMAYYAAFTNGLNAVLGNDTVRNPNTKPTTQQENAA